MDMIYVRGRNKYNVLSVTLIIRIIAFSGIIDLIISSPYYDEEKSVKYIECLNCLLFPDNFSITL